MLTMKHIITLIIVTVFTAVAAQAGEQCCKDKAACDSKAKALKTAKANASAKGAQLLVRK